MLVRVTFQEGVSDGEANVRRTEAVVQVGHSVLEIAQSKAVAINAPCGGRASCGKCLVRVLSGPMPISEGDQQMLSSGMISEGLRLACQLRPRMPTTVEVQTRFDIHGAPTVRAAPGLDLAARPQRVVVAVDLGSTSVQMRVIDADDGRVTGEVSLLNKQVRRGHDVMTRLTHALKGAGSLRELTDDARETLREMWKAARGSLAANDATVQRWVIAGNSVMTHMLWGVSIDSLAEAPYRPAFTEARTGAATELDLEGGTVLTMPLLGSFVGGDTAAAILALDLDRVGPPRMLIDIGTNTEVVLAHDDQIWLCSTPAGPAFEGGNISVGMRAEPGAITSIEVREGRIRPQTVGGVKAKGICGTGLMQVVVELVRGGLILADGEIVGADRVALSRGVELLQADIRELQLAKGALRAATRIVLAEAGLKDRDLTRVMLAGAFGSHLSAPVAIEARMIPNIDPVLVEPVGNASLEGATRMALEPEACAERLAAVQAKLKHVELAMHANFQRLFVDSLNF